MKTTIKDPVLICSTTNGGCGYVGNGTEWTTVDIDANIVLCPKCLEDHMYQLFDENFDNIIGDSDQERARKLLDIYHERD